MIKRVSAVLIFTFMCVSNYKAQGEKFRLNNHTGYALDATLVTVNGLPNTIFLRRAGDYSQFIKAYRILGKEITVYSSKNKGDNKINLYYKVVPINGRERIFE